MKVEVRDLFRDATAAAAAESAVTVFGGANPIAKFHLKKKPAYQLRTIYDDLVVRKLARNLRHLTGHPKVGRAQIVRNLRHFLREGVPYRVYRLDVRSFYESFCPTNILDRVNATSTLSPLSKKHLEVLMAHYQSLGGVGLPRGMALSAVLSDVMMRDFDSWMLNHPSVYFYGRYVDDIVIVTNLTEDKKAFSLHIEEQLPPHLRLNKKKEMVKQVTEKAKACDGGTRQLRLCIDYLGYRFSVFDPIKSDKEAANPIHRYVETDIAPAKIKRMKLRIIRALRDFATTHNAGLLVDRIRFLTSNFSIVDRNTGKRQLAGIYYGYPSLSPGCSSLKDLDMFLRNALLCKRGRVFGLSFPSLTSGLKRRLLSCSFEAGHAAPEKKFVHFSTSRIHDIQECWRYE